MGDVGGGGVGGDGGDAPVTHAMEVKKGGVLRGWSECPRLEMRWWKRIKLLRP